MKAKFTLRNSWKIEMNFVKRDLCENSITKEEVIPLTTAGALIENQDVLMNARSCIPLTPVAAESTV
jgi:hypothetical protein